MLKKILLLVVFTLVYIFLLTVLFEYFINKPSDTLLTLSGLLLFFLVSFIYVTILIKTFKQNFK